MSISELVVTTLLVLGTVVMLLASTGLLRFGDVYLRMHAATKASTLGIGFIVFGAAAYFGDTLLTVKLISLTALFLLTSPIGAQTLARAAHTAGAKKVEQTWIDDLARDRAANGTD
jgi:multicomponent Na+:H+ antiporter subunit G